MEPKEDNTTIEKPHEVTRKFSKKIFFLLFIVIVIISGLFLLKSSKPLPNNKNGPQSNVIKQYEQWVNCNDVRDVIEENGKIYAACLGGVLIVDAQSGSVIDQITTTNGLGSSTTTSLAKKDEVLYIGTQDGFTIFNLKTRKAKKISKEEGLISGSNIILELDGNILWVGTFEGLSKYDITTRNITNYTEELADNSTNFSINDILATPESLYLIISANDGSQGSVTRLDKKTGEWKRFGPDYFGETGEFARIDFDSITYADKSIYISNSYAIWQNEDSLSLNWEKIDLKAVNNLNQGVDVIEGETPKLYLINENVLYSHDASKGIVEIPDIDQTIIKNYNWGGVIFNNGKFWFQRNDNKEWLTSINPSKQKTAKIALNDRPVNFIKILSAIDSKPIILTNDSIWTYDKKSVKLVPLFDLKINLGFDPENTRTNFIPISETNNIYLNIQSCGQGCSLPEIYLIDFHNKSAKKIAITNEIIAALKPPESDYSEILYEDMAFLSFDSKLKKVKYTLGYIDQKVAILDLNSLEWTVSNAQETTQDINGQRLYEINCNKLYTFAEKGVFNDAACVDNLISDSYRWEASNDWPFATIEQMDIKSGNKKTINITPAEKEYSPFEGFDNISINSAAVINNHLWLATNRGLIIHNPLDDKSILVDTKEGLISNDVRSFLKTESELWVITNWGGLSRIPY